MVNILQDIVEPICVPFFGFALRRAVGKQFIPLNPKTEKLFDRHYKFFRTTKFKILLNPTLAGPGS